jgi:hypothetical protein
VPGRPSPGPGIGDEIPALWQRIAVSSALAAPLGWAAGRFAGAGTVAVGKAAGR